ncbi:unnamed protein product [Brachionus calyciflorus]|uniref:Transporter n=1 Tax=Brachionus calyciflorus TaxID=104777 RepID=A0A813QLT6_9BILA|nr:unnamed protein product [Brachionus calyciflorus]
MIEAHNKNTTRKNSVVQKLFYDDSKEAKELLNPQQEKCEQRAQWDSFMEYFLSIIGFVIDLGNVWRFPTVCYQNGGGAFLIPFLVCLFVIGMPCMYLELAAGQYFQQGNISIWTKINPYMKGIGFAVVIVNILMLSYYNTLQAYALYYLAFSFQSPLPWSDCNRSWNTNSCHLRVNDTNTSYDINSPASEFFTHKLLGSYKSSGFNDLKSIKPDILLALILVFILTTSCLIGGIKTSGKAVYVTALLPYVCLAVLIFQSLLLDGSYEGLKYYLTPKFDKIFELKVWLAASVQVFFSLGPGFGVLITYSSYTKKNTNIKNLTILCSIVNCLTSLLYGVVVFAGLGYMAKRLSVDINYFLKDGIGLVYVVYPEIISTFKMAYIFAIVFFIMLITLGMDSAFAGMEGLFTAITDEFPICRKYALTTRFLISVIPFLTSLPTVTYGGIYVVQWMDTFAISPSVLVVVCVETVTISWFYGLDKFCKNIKEMNSRTPYLNWRISWKYLCPSILFLIVVLDILFFEGLQYGSYIYPDWSVNFGYLINIFALLPIPGYALFCLLKNKL